MGRLTALVVTAFLLLISGLKSASPLLASPAAQTTSAWTGSYFGNRSLQGSPLFTRDDPNVDFVWGNGAPDPLLPASDFSVRWVRWMFFDTPGNWTFTTINNDGVRLYIDDVPYIDAWSDQPVTAHTITVNLTQAFHLVRMEYYDHSGSAEAHLQMISAGFPDWRGEYYSNSNLSGTPAFVRNDSTLNFNFGTSGPGGGIPGENFSVRWSRRLYLDAGRYRFTTRTDDGVRLWVDNQLLVDQWHDQTPKNWLGEITLSAGNHLIRMEYFNHEGAGLAVLTWIPVPGSAEIWHGDYFDNSGVSGNPALSRDDTDINFDWGTAAPGAGISSGANWSARFTSRRVVTLAGYYTVSATADDGVRVWVDNAILIDQWHDQPPTTFAATIYLNPGSHDWRVEFYQHNGAASLRVQIIPGVLSPAPSDGTATTSAVADVYVDDNAPGFVKGGPEGRWHDYPAGYGNHAYWIQNDTFSQPLYSWVRWYPRLPGAGWYQVSVFIPGNLATTRNARYWIAHAGTYDLQSLNQSLYANQWTSLGRFYFAATGDEFVSVADVTYEPLQSTVLVVDAIRFSPR
ncbi:MAG TPA: PA14 domain-containing protein [Anaerolineae bacterium]